MRPVPFASVDVKQAPPTKGGARKWNGAEEGVFRAIAISPS